MSYDIFTGNFLFYFILFFCVVFYIFLSSQVKSRGYALAQGAFRPYLYGNVFPPINIICPTTLYTIVPTLNKFSQHSTNKRTYKRAEHSLK